MIFTKNPILGTAKTRIGKVKGDELALEIYKRLLLYTKELTAPLSCKKVVYFNKHIELHGIWDDRFEKRIQVKGDLGDKMGAAFKEEFEISEKVLIIGSDCAELTEDDITRAFQLLEENDFVFGPAADGGYYLLGMVQFHSFLFENMPWSEEGLLEESIKKIENRGLSYQLLPTKSDIDYWEDWEKLNWDL
jgi:rSAM/selenodomain-associated transferase 1